MPNHMYNQPKLNELGYEVLPHLSMGILQARILEWVAMPSSRGSSRLRDRTQVSRIAGGFFTIWATKEIPWGQSVD